MRRPSEELSLQIQSVDLAPRSPTSHRAVLHTSRGDLHAILHPAPGSDSGAVFVGGAIGGFAGPGDRLYARWSDELPPRGISCLRLHYRKSNFFEEAVLDVLGGVAFLKGTGVKRVVLVGHSFGGAVVITAGGLSDAVVAVAALSSQTYGAQGAAQVSPRPLLLVHGKSDTRLSHRCSEQIYSWAKEPKELVLYDGAEHSLRECDAQLHALMLDWLPAHLAAAPETPGARSDVPA